ncbi:tubulin binding cofactor C domain-containing protein [Actinidia rufa]|uniref:Tubulin binding cofactor C domain-containing protein n=1 Tax=Actinidia rufa TaxID=165716 RepID=A0A7J0GD99_9ERIC|nr:tubulin binding cofactor C domain-containing protein [Actinidia rufa]
MTDNTEPSTTSTSSTTYVHPRREPFKHGLIPIPKLIFTDDTQTVASLKEKLVHRSTQSPTHQVDSIVVSETLQISPDHAQLIIDTLTVVIKSDPEIESVGVDVFDD